MKTKFGLLGILLLLACAIVLCVLLPRGGKKTEEAVPGETAAPTEEKAAPEKEEEAVIEQQEETVTEATSPAAPPLTAAAREEEEDTEQPELERPAENPDYRGGNGTVLSYVASDWVRKIIRSCEMEITIRGMPSDQWRIVYADMEKEVAVTTLQDGDRISLLQQCTLEYLTEPGDGKGGSKGDLWYKVRLADGTPGWICPNDEYLYGTTPYYGNSYEILGTVSAGGRKWTARRMSQTLSVRENLGIRDKPGNSGSVLCTIRPGDSDPAQTDVQVTAITEEEDSQGGMTDRWVKVKYGDYEGWVFGGYLSAKRGGPKYCIPGDWIAFELGGGT